MNEDKFKLFYCQPNINLRQPCLVGTRAQVDAYMAKFDARKSVAEYFWEEIPYKI